MHPSILEWRGIRLHVTHSHPSYLLASPPSSPLQDAFLERHGVKLGFMSAFVKAAAEALKEVPAVNAVIDGDEIVYRCGGGGSVDGGGGCGGQVTKL